MREDDDLLKAEDNIFTDEELEWLRLTPEQRLLETTKLWQLYISLGGNLAPEPDTQSPFYFEEFSS